MGEQDGKQKEFGEPKGNGSGTAALQTGGTGTTKTPADSETSGNISGAASGSVNTFISLEIAVSFARSNKPWKTITNNF